LTPDCGLSLPGNRRRHDTRDVRTPTLASENVNCMMRVLNKRRFSRAGKNPGLKDLKKVFLSFRVFKKFLKSFKRFKNILYCVKRF